MYTHSFYVNNNEADPSALNRVSGYAPIIQSSSDSEKHPISHGKIAFITKGMDDCNLLTYFLELAFSSDLVLLDFISYAASIYSRMDSAKVYALKAKDESTVSRKVSMDS